MGVEDDELALDPEPQPEMTAAVATSPIVMTDNETTELRRCEFTDPPREYGPEWPASG
jgi:hypothetical protein